MKKFHLLTQIKIICFHGLARGSNVCLVTKKLRTIKKIAVCLIFLHVSGQLLPCNGQPDLLTYLRDHSAIFPGFGDDFETLGMSVKLL